MGFRKMAKDPEGNTYVAERSVDGDAVLKVVGVPVTDFPVARRGDVVYWPEAPYEVSAPDKPAVRVIRFASGAYDVPGKASRVSMTDAVRIALGRMQPPAPRAHRATVRTVRAGRASTAQRDGHNLSTEANAPAGSVLGVLQEPQENWDLKQGDRIMRHLALYPNGVDAQTMSAGMHDLSSTKIRTHLRRLIKGGGPVAEPRQGVYARREAS
jgi:hypothetical protein